MPTAHNLDTPHDAYRETNLPLEHDERWLLVQRILGSKHFVKASQLREILTYVTHQVILDEGVAIPEHEIACKVLGRREGFNPNDDNIVRVQAGHLRKKLKQYFAAEGREEPYVLEIPKGAYVPHFVPRSNTDETPSVLAADTSLTARAEQEAAFAFPRTQAGTENELAVAGLPDQAPIKAQWKLQSLPKVPWYWLLAAFSLGIVAMICFYRLASTPPLIAAARGLPRNIIEQRIFASGAPLSIVTTDSSLVLLQNTLHTDISIFDYVGGQYPSNQLAQSSDDARRVTLEYATTGRYTSLGDLTISWQCQELAQQLGTSATLRYARYMSVRDFEKGNFILIGSRRGNPWVSLFEPQLNFALEENKETHLFHFLDKNPRPGEQKIYANEQEPHGDYLSYVAVAVIPNLTKTGYVLLLNGTIMDSNEAAAHLIFDGDLSDPLLREINHQITDKSEFIEIFLRVHSLQGAPSKFDIIATRTGHVNS